MAISLTIRVNSQNGIQIEKLPESVFTGQFPFPEDAVTKNVISIITAGDYQLEVVSSECDLSNPTYAGEAVKAPEPSPGRIVFPVLGQLANEQLWGVIGFTAGGVTYSIGVLVNPPVLQVPVTVDPADGVIYVDEADVPYGLHFNPNQDWFRTWSAGNYLYTFSLSPQQGKFLGVQFEPGVPPLPWGIGDDELSLWMRNDNLTTRPTAEAIAFKILVYGRLHGDVIPIDPTIINNPINQGGDGGVANYEEERRSELAGVFAA